MREGAKGLSSLTVIRDDTCFIMLPDPERGGSGASGRRDAKRHVRSRKANLQVNLELAAPLEESWYTNGFVGVCVVRPHVSAGQRTNSEVPLQTSHLLFLAATQMNQEDSLSLVSLKFSDPTQRLVP